MGCCGDDQADKPGVVRERKCRDVLCLLLFLIFWAGMFVICGFAAKNGNSNRLVYGVDSYGFTCGSVTTYKNVTIDNSENKNVYWLNALDLLTVENIPFAKSVCVSGCPSSDNVCDAYGDLPCTQAKQYVCPYYAFAQDDLYSRLAGVDAGSTAWFAALTTMGPTYDAGASAVVQKLEAQNIPWVNSVLTANNITTTSNVSGPYYQLKSDFPGAGPCYPVWVPTSPFFNRCFPNFPSNWTSGVVSTGLQALGSDATDKFKDEFNSVSAQWTRYVGSISKGILIIIVGGLCGGVVLSLFWMVILRYLSGFMAWITVLAVNVALVGVTLYSFSFAGYLGDDGVGGAIASKLPGEDPTSLDRTTWKWIAIAAAIVTGLVFLLTILCISRIRIAIACIKVASQAVGAMPSILLFPLLPFVFEVALIIYWISITALLYTAGDLTANCRTSAGSAPLTFSQLPSFYNTSATHNSTDTGTFTCYTNATMEERVSACGSDPNCYISYDWNNEMKYAFIYHFFGLLWTNQFIIGFTCVTIAGAIGSYYWAAADPDGVPALPVLASLKNTLIYHLGSVAFGAFIIAVIQFIRFLLEYIDRKTQALQEGNIAAKWLMCCVKCCMWCLEKIMAFINRNAYIMIGVKGTGYCASAGRAITLIVSNALRLAVVNVVGDLLLFLGKICVAAACGCIAFAMSTLPFYTDPEKHPETYINSPILPVALSILTGYAVAEIFFSVFEMAIDTIMLSFCEDCETNGGNPRYAPQLLMDVMGVQREQGYSGNTVKPLSG